MSGKLGPYELNSIVTGDARELDPSWFAEKFRVIVADPPWQYRLSKGQGAAIDQYQAMSDAEIMAMPIKDIAHPNSVLFLWATWPKLVEAMQVVSAWGFEYITGLPWIKTSKNNVLQYGVGHWVRGCSEPVLIAKRGNSSPPQTGDYMGILSPNLYHSRKPDSIHQIAEGLPGPYLELFARRPRVGWSVFGNELESYLPGVIETALPQPVQLDLLGVSDG